MTSTNWIAYKTIIYREINRFTRIWSQTLLPSPISMTLYFLIFGAIIGPRIGQFEGVSFVQFITPGLIMMAIITNSYGNVVASFFQAKFLKSIEEMLVSPMSHWVLLWGYVTGGIIRGILVALIVLLVSFVFTDFHVYHPIYAVCMVFLTAMLFALAGLINAIFAQKFDDINFIPTFILTPLSYLGGVFYSIKALPSFWQAVSFLNPIFYMVNGFRYAMLNISDVSSVQAMGVLLLLNVGALSWALYLLKNGIGLKN
jgi:ABC-2 type transport system permease protein